MIWLKNPSFSNGSNWASIEAHLVVACAAMDVALVYPDIPWNTGNVARTCVATGSLLHLVEPLGFSLEDKWLKRAGLDYWKDLKLKVHPDFPSFLQTTAHQQKFFFSRFAEKLYWEAEYPSDGILIFGSETSGLPAEIKSQYPESLFRIPTPGPVRSLNLSTSVGIALFEAIRQNQTKGVGVKS